MTTATMQAPKGQVFISYRRADAEIAERLYSLLLERGVDAWYDGLIPSSADWRDAIVEQLGRSRLMVILLSSAALESEELKKELAVAAQEKVRILTARLENVQPRQAFAYELTRGQFFDVFPDQEERLAALADEARDLVNAPTTSLGRSFRVALPRMPGKRYRLAMVFASSGLVLMLYQRQVDAWNMLIASGLSPFKATGFLVVAATLGSPFILVSLLRAGPGLSEAPLMLAAAANTVLIVLIIRDVFRSIGARRARAAQRVNK